MQNLFMSDHQKNTFNTRDALSFNKLCMMYNILPKDSLMMINIKIPLTYKCVGLTNGISFIENSFLNNIKFKITLKNIRKKTNICKS